MYHITRHVSIEGNLPIVYYIYTSQIIPSFPSFARDRDDAMAMGEEEEGWGGGGGGGGGGAREGDEDGRRTRDGRRLGVE